MRLGDMELGEAPEKEYRAQWIRDAARDFMIAHLSVGAEQGRDSSPRMVDENGAWVPALPALHTLASSLGDLYVKERK